MHMQGRGGEGSGVLFGICGRCGKEKS